MRVSKRTFLAIVGSGLAALAGAHHFRSQLRERAARWRPRLPDSPVTGSLGEKEVATLLAFAGVLTEGEELSDEGREALREHIRIRTENYPGYLSLFRITAARLERLGHQNFTRLRPAERERLVKEDGLLQYHVSTRESLLPFNREQRMIRALAVPDLIGAYYRSPAGWAVVRYASFPGRCGDLKRYTRAEG